LVVCSDQFSVLIHYFGRIRLIPIIIIITIKKTATESELAKLTVQPAQAIVVVKNAELPVIGVFVPFF
jgi:hypothetical protein